MYEKAVRQLPSWEEVERLRQQRRRQQIRRRTTTESPINIEEEFIRPRVRILLIQEILDFLSLK